MKRLCFVIFSVLAFGQSLLAQYDTAWVRRLEGPSHDWSEAHAITVDDSGNVIVTGWSRISNSANDFDWITVKYDRAGQQLWVRELGSQPGYYVDEASQVATDHLGNVYVAGFFSNTQYSAGAFTVIKYSPAGDSLWLVTGLASLGHVNGIAIDDSGNVYVTGPSSMGGSDYLTIKYDTDGNEVWHRWCGNATRYNSTASALALDRFHNVYVTGQSRGSYITVKYNTNGDTLWAARYFVDSTKQNLPTAIAVDDSGNVYVTGASATASTSTDYATVKYDSSGNQLWVVRYSSSGYNADGATALAIDDNGGVYVTGASEPGGVPSIYVTIKYNSHGDSLWAARYIGPGNSYDHPRAIAVDSSGNVIVAGDSYGLTSSWDYTTIVYDNSGQQKWIGRYFYLPGNHEDEIYAMTLDKHGNIYVTGRSWDSTAADYATIKYSPVSVGVKDVTRQLPVAFELSQNYPNPFNPKTKIQFTIVNRQLTIVKVYDVLGRDVATLVNEVKQPGTYTVEFDGSNLASGVYFYRLQAEDFVSTKKLVLLK